MKNQNERSGFYSIKTTIILFFIISIVIFVSLTGFFSYVTASKQLRKNFYSNVSDIVLQSKNYLDTRMSDVFEQMVALVNDIDTLSIISNLNSMGEQMITPAEIIRLDSNLERIFTSYFNIIDSIIIYFNNGAICFIKKNYLSSKINISFEALRDEYHDSPSNYYWINIHKNRFLDNLEEENRIVSIIKILGEKNSIVRGIIAFNFRESFFKKILYNPRISENGYLTIVSRDGIMAFKQVDEAFRLDSNARDKILSGKEVSGNLSLNLISGCKIGIVYNSLEINDWRLAAVFPKNDIFFGVAYLMSFNFILFIALLVTVIMLYIFLTRTITQPVILLSKKVKQAEDGNLNVPFNINTTNEIGILNNGIGSFIERIKKLLEQIEERKEIEKKAELEIMHSQMSPHFLYNTLQSIKQLCDTSNTNDASIMLQSLGQFYRKSLSGGRKIITIEEELEHVKSYLLIQQMRYSEVFDYEISVEPDIFKKDIIKLSLQPLVENAIYHGVKLKRERGMIRITGYEHNGEILLEIFDNGAGITKEKLKQIKRGLRMKKHSDSPGIGIYNVHWRLKLHFGEPYGLAIESFFGQSTTVSIKVPKR